MARILIRRIARTWFVSLGTCLVAQAQTLPPDAPAPPAPSAAYSPNQSPVAQGIVARYLINPHGEVDGLLLSDGTQVKFPPHMSAELTAAIKPGQVVAVQGVRESQYSVKAFVIESGAARIVEHRPLAAPPPPDVRDGQLQALRADGSVQQLLYGKRGEVNGVLLSDGSIVRFPPHAAYGLGALLQVGQPLSATGYGTQNQYGRALEATTLGAPGQPAQILYGPPGPRG